MTHARNLTFAHLWVAFIAFTIALVLGVWQMWARSPLPAPFLTASTYFSSVTAHGTATAYVLTTFMVMGFGYYVAETALARPLPAPRWAWIAFALGVGGTLMAVVTILTGRATVLFTFYPPLIAIQRPDFESAVRQVGGDFSVQIGGRLAGRDHFECNQR